MQNPVGVIIKMFSCVLTYIVRACLTVGYSTERAKQNKTKQNKTLVDKREKTLFTEIKKAK